MKVLVACEFSGIVRDAFIQRGHEAWSVDLLPTESDFGPHLQLNLWEDGKLRLPEHGEGPWDLLISHPPCTYLCTSGVRWLYTKLGRW